MTLYINCLIFFLGGPYCQLAGRDASRALVNVSMDVLKEGYDDISDLNAAQKASLDQWLKKFVGEFFESQVLRAI